MLVFVALSVFLSLELASADVGCFNWKGDPKGYKYRGSKSTTKDGLACQKWTEQAPNAHTRTPEGYPNKGLGDHNFCRNPDDEPGGPWCYNSQGTSPRWDYCGIPDCPVWTMKVICDDQMNLWIDGELTPVAGQGVWNQMSTLSILQSTRSIGIKCKNTGGPYGITGSVQDADGNDVLVTDNSWSCSNTADEGWAGPGFEEGANWNAASYYPHRNYINHNSGPWREMSANKQIIWTGTSADTTVYCRKALPVAGGWSDYGDWADCSVECGGGTQSSSRSCNNPAPANGGADCQGDAQQTRSCNPDPCPVDGGWSDYGDWSECSVNDGGAGGLDGGTQSRSRTCDNPAQANGGADCQGDAEDTRSCPVLGGLNWVPFAVSKQAVISTDFSDQAMERFYVKYPCADSIWFKLFLRRDDGANSHVEIFSKVKGNIYCNAAGAKNWWGGEKTDFTMADGAMKCESDGKNIIIIVEKTADRVTIKNKGQVLYNQAFAEKDANCRKATTSVKTQVWNYEGWLDLGVFDNSAPLNLAKQSSCFVQDFDYGQADIKKITKVDSAESCLAQCGKQTGCLSMAFVPGKGDCWLKNLLYGQNPKPKVGVISANLVCQVPRLMKNNCVKTNFDYWGADIKKVDGVSSLMECADKCRDTEGGKSVAFVPSSGDCWVKYLENGARPEDKDGVNSVALSCLAEVFNGVTGAKDGCGERCVDKGVDYWGADIKNVNPVYTIEECTALCYVEDGCVSVTHRPSTQDCWLKNKPNGQNGKSFLDTVNSINLNCFLLAHAVTDGCVKENYDFRGADIRMVPNVLSVENCAALCGDEAGCVSVTHQPATSRCWLKNKIFGADPQDMDGVSSRNLQCGDVWCEHAGSFLYTYANSPRIKYADFEEAKRACVENDLCKGITQEPYSQNKYTLRRGPTIHDWSPTNETSWTLC